MARIGILTLAPTDNYGGLLQAMSLVQIMKELGHDVILLYKPHVDPFMKGIIRKILLAIPFHNLYDLRNKKKQYPARKKLIALHRQILSNEVCLSPNLYSYDDLYRFCLEQNLDAVIVGSDQVWRRSYIDDRYFLAYFLNFVPRNIRKYSYAASFGTSFWEDDKVIPKINKLLEKFTAISVREKSGVEICTEVFSQKNVAHVLDPTLLFNKQHYIDNFIKKYNTTMDMSVITAYILDESTYKNHLLSSISKIKQIDSDQIKVLTTKYDGNNFISVSDWLSAFNYTDYIITDSFHGMVFAIIFEKQFIVIANPDRGLDRFTSLLGMLDLEDRLINNIDSQIVCSILDRKIDYQLVRSRLKELRSASIGFLKNI